MASVGKRAWEIYRVLIGLIALACVAQIYLAGRGAFGISGDAAIGDQSSFDPHRTLGSIIGAAAVIALVLALVLWDMQLVVWTLVLAVLAVAVQNVTPKADNAWISGVHAVSGTAVLVISAWLAHKAWRHKGAAESAV